MSKEHLSTYLNDHLSGAAIAIEILDHLANEAEDLRPILLDTKAEIEADRLELIELMQTLDIQESRLRKAGRWFAEQFAEAKFEVDDQTGGPLQRLERLEVLVLGIEGKLALWRALEAASTGNPQLSGVDYGRLAQRAIEQRDRMDVLRIQTAQSALSLAA
jgi:hypothetical protein